MRPNADNSTGPFSATGYTRCIHYYDALARFHFVVFSPSDMIVYSLEPPVLNQHQTRRQMTTDSVEMTTNATLLSRQYSRLEYVRTYYYYY